MNFSEADELLKLAAARQQVITIFLALTPTLNCDFYFWFLSVFTFGIVVVRFF